jgi:hypothetical protein
LEALGRRCGSSRRPRRGWVLAAVAVAVAVAAAAAGVVLVLVLEVVAGPGPLRRDPWAPVAPH